MTDFFAGLLAGAMGALGLGGGSVLLLYLTLVLNTDQLAAQGVNLLFFLPVAAVSLFFHHRSGLVRWRMVWPAAALGLLGVWGGSALAGVLGSGLLAKLFGGLLLILGLREFITAGRPHRGSEKTNSSFE